MASYYLVFNVRAARCRLTVHTANSKQQTYHTIAFHSNHRARIASSSFAKWKRNHLLCLHSSVSSMCTLTAGLLILFILHSVRLENILLFCRAIIISLSWIWEMWNVSVWIVEGFLWADTSMILRLFCSYSTRYMVGKLHEKLRENKLFALNNVVRSNNLI